MNKDRRVTYWMWDVIDGMDWYPGKVPSVEELVVGYIEDLEKEVAKLRKFQSDEMWRRDQASEHRMGL